MVYIKTQQLLLRNLSPADSQVIYRYRNDEACARYQRWEDTSLDSISRMISKHREDVFPSTQEEQHYAISLYDDTCIGDLSCFHNAQDNCVTFGITIAPEHQRKGYAYELLREVISSVQQKYPMMDIVALIDPENQNSIRLFSKLGFEMECYAPSISSCVYTIYGSKTQPVTEGK